MKCGPTIITERINELKLINDVTASEIAKMIDVSVNTVRNWFKGKSEPNLINIIKLACYFNTHYDYIVGNTDEINPPNLPKSAKFIAVMNISNFRFYPVGCVGNLNNCKLINCYITSNCDRFIYATYGKIRFQLSNYYDKED